MAEKQELKPVAECKTLAEVMASLNQMVKELNEIPGVEASMNVGGIENVGGEECHKTRQ